jgi:WD40 repeat protein
MSQFNSAAFSRDGSRVVATGKKRARLWDASSGKQIAKLVGHTGDVFSAEHENGSFA